MTAICGMVPFDFGPPPQNQPAHVQGNREKAAEGIRTLDLLHGNGQGHLGAAPHNYGHLRRFWALPRERTYAAIRSDMHGYAGFWALPARSAQNMASRFQRAVEAPAPAGLDPLRCPAREQVEYFLSVRGENGLPRL